MWKLQGSDCSWQSASVFIADVTGCVRQWKRIGLYSILGSNLLWSNILYLFNDLPWLTQTHQDETMWLFIVFQITLSSVRLSLSEVGCFRALCNEALLRSLNVFLYSHKGFVFQLSHFCASWGYFIFLFLVFEKCFGNNMKFYIETGFQCLWFQYSWHLEEKGGKSQNNDMGSDPGALRFQNYYASHILQKVAVEKQ
jgi:hypothetical protein